MAKKFDKRKYMQMAIDEMIKSIDEPRKDGKASPKVGALLVTNEGMILGSAHRGELREGDHAEYTLIDRKLRDKDISGTHLFATLEPCAPDSRKHPKIGCAERIVNARIKKVWVGIGDPDPTVDGKGIKFLMDCGIEVEMFDKDLQDIIEKENQEFSKQAILRSHEIKKVKIIEFSSLEKTILSTTIEEFSQDALKHYISRANLKMEPDDPRFLILLEQQQLIQPQNTSADSIQESESEKFRRNDVLPLLVWKSGFTGNDYLIDKFINNGDRVKILGYEELDKNNSYVEIKSGWLDKNQEFSISIKSKPQISKEDLCYHIDLLFQDKDGRNYKQELFKKLREKVKIEEPKLIHSKEYTYNPTGLGILLFGKNPRNRFPQAVLKVEARYGNSEPEIHDFPDALVLIPDKVEEWLKKILTSKISRDRFARTTEYDYPISILREAVINALIHRDYENEGAKCYLSINDDNIIIKSPGLPVAPIKFEDFKKLNAPSLSRNPKLMAVFNTMNYVEERGIGMREMKSLPEKYNLPLPLITWEDPYLVITLARSQKFLETIVGKELFSKLTEEEQKGLIYIYEVKEVSKAQYSKHFGLNAKKAQRQLAKFKELNIVKSFGKSTSIKYMFNNK